jgi:hypothetical protein
MTLCVTFYVSINKAYINIGFLFTKNNVNDVFKSLDN